MSVVSTLAIGIQLVIILYLSEWTLRNAGYVERDDQRNRYVRFFSRLTASFILSSLLTFILAMGESDLIFSVLYYLPAFLFFILAVHRIPCAGGVPMNLFRWSLRLIDASVMSFVYLVAGYVLTAVTSIYGVFAELEMLVTGDGLPWSASFALFPFAVLGYQL